MELFSKLLGGKGDSNKAAPERDWKKTLHGCNFFMARRVIGDIVFRFANEQAQAEGKEVVWKEEIADRWRQFALDPCYESAVGLINVMPEVLPFFDGKTQRSIYPPIWSAMSFRSDGDPLPLNVDDIKQVTELSVLEYQFFCRKFKEEVIYKCAPITFMGGRWEFMVSTVHSKIYKWAASLEPASVDDAESIGNEVTDYCIRFLGATTEEQLGRLTWDTTDGNVILQLTNLNGCFDISIFITSREVRKLGRL